MKFYIVDVFAQQKYQGNQLAVLVPDREISDKEMQQIAREINFSETTFIMSSKQANGGYDVRVFTPDSEIPFAGHPTLGTAYVIHKFAENEKSDKVLLNLKVGPIPVTVSSDTLTMRQNEPVFDKTIGDADFVADILSINKDDICRDYPLQIVSTGLPCIVVPLKTIDALKRCRIDHSKFQHFIDTVYKCNLLVFAPDTEYDIRVRVFMDDTGFFEDPATGSANGNLAGYFLKYNYFGKDKIKYTVGQGHEINRPSIIKAEAEKIGSHYNILIGGRVQMVASGEW